MNFALDILIKSTTLLLISGLLIFVLQRQSATLKHWILSLTMVGLLSLPVVTGLIPDWEWSTISYTQPEFIEAEVFQEHFMASSASSESPIDTKVVEGTKSVVPIESIKPVKSGITWNVPKVLFFTWLAGFLILQFRLWVGIGYVKRITKKGKAFKHSAQEAILSKVVGSDKVAIITSSFINTPMTWGFLNPKILLPTAAVNWKVDRLALVLTHELAHIQRKDYLLHVITLVVSSLYWFNPLVWLAKSHQLIEREKACDEYVLNLGISPTSYAEQLVTMTKKLMNTHPLIAAHSLPMAQPSQMKQRILAILQFQKSDFDPYKKWGASFLFVALLLSLSTVSVYAKKAILPVSITEEGKLNIELPAFMNTEKVELPKPTEKTTESSTEKIDKPKRVITKKRVISKLNTRTLSEIPVNVVAALPKLEKLSEVLPTTPKPTAAKSIDLYGEWQEGKKTYRIWTTGQFKYFSHYPYFKELSDDAVIIIEVTKNGKTERLIYSKIPQSGHFLLPTSKKGGIKESQLRHGRDSYVSIPLEHGRSVYSMTRVRKGNSLLTLERNKERIFYQAKRNELNSSSDLVWFDYPVDDTFYKWKHANMLDAMLAILKNQDSWSDLTNNREKWQAPIKAHQTLLNNKMVTSNQLMERHLKAVEKSRNQKHEAATQKLSELLTAQSVDFEAFQQLEASTKAELKTLFPTIAQQFLRKNSVNYSDGYARLGRTDKVQLINLSITFNEQVEQSENLKSLNKSQFVGFLEEVLSVFRTYSIKAN